MTREEVFDEYSLNLLPEHMRDGMYRWIAQGIKPGSFGMAVLENDLVEAFSCADEVNTARMKDWASWLFNCAPNKCWGSAEKVAAWAAHRGLSGLKNEE